MRASSASLNSGWQSARNTRAIDFLRSPANRASQFDVRCRGQQLAASPPWGDTGLAVPDLTAIGATCPTLHPGQAGRAGRPRATRVCQPPAQPAASKAREASATSATAASDFAGRAPCDDLRTLDAPPLTITYRSQVGHVRGAGRTVCGRGDALQDGRSNRPSD